MNRRVLWALLAIVPVVALVAPLRRATSFRPVKIGSVINSRANNDFATSTIGATDREVCANFFDERPTLFDLKTGKIKVWSGGVTAGGEALWQLSASGAPRLSVRDAAGTRDYAMSAGAHKQAREADAASVIVSLSPSQVMMFTAYQLHRWNRKSGALKASVSMDEWRPFLGRYALTRDGRNIVSASSSGIEWISTQSKAQTRRVPLMGHVVGFGKSVSPFGSYASYEDQSAGAKPTSHAMVDARTGRMLWRFEVGDRAVNPVFSSDEKWVAISRSAPYRWELREARSGRVVGTLVSVFRVPNGGDGPAQFGAFSPDGATFYSLTPQGDVYRQRAR